MTMTHHIQKFAKNSQVQLILWVLYALFTVANMYLAIRNFPILERIAKLEFEVLQINKELDSNRPLISRYLVTESQITTIQAQINDINRKLDILINQGLNGR